MKFTNLVAGHTFYIVDAGKTPDGTWTKCAFCGMRLKYWVAIKREDGIKRKVGVLSTYMKTENVNRESCLMLSQEGML